MKGNCFGYVIVFLLMFGVSYGVVCGLVKLITLCFGLDFSWAIGTGIWLILILINGSLSIRTKK